MTYFLLSQKLVNKSVNSCVIEHSKFQKMEYEVPIHSVSGFDDDSVIHELTKRAQLKTKEAQIMEIPKQNNEEGRYTPNSFS